MIADTEQQHLAANQRHYESAATVATLDSWYTADKEVALVDFVQRLRPGVFAGRCLEVGGGAGVHGGIIARTPGCRYVHSDYSQALCRAAAAKGLTTLHCSGLDIPLADGAVDVVVAVGPSTLIGTWERRRRQFEEFQRVLKKG